jgi:hypothetical protein
MEWVCRCRRRHLRRSVLAGVARPVTRPVVRARHRKSPLYRDRCLGRQDGQTLPTRNQPPTPAKGRASATADAPDLIGHEDERFISQISGVQRPELGPAICTEYPVASNVCAHLLRRTFRNDSASRYRASPHLRLWRGRTSIHGRWVGVGPGWSWLVISWGISK